MEFKKKLFEKFYILIAIFIYLLFFYVSYSTPLSGDDWGYALNVMNSNPFIEAYKFYFSWSGRYIGEVLTFFLAGNKWFFNFFNPLLFALIFFFSYKLIDHHKYKILSCLLFLALMISVDDNLRMETYSWIAGETFVFSLCLSLLYFYIINNLINKDIYELKDKIIFIISNLIIFLACNISENISAMLVVSTIILTIYYYFKHKVINKYLIFNFIFSLLSFMILRLSPGSSYRLFRDSFEWMKLSLIEKIIGAYPNFLETTFINNNYLILFLSIVLIFSALSSEKIKNIFKVTLISFNLIAIFIVFSFIFDKNSFLLSGNSLLNMIFWPLYIIILFLYLFINKDLKIIFFTLIGGGSSLIMLLSPIYGARSSIFMHYYIFIVIIYLISKINNKYYIIILYLLSFFVILDRVKEYYYKYQLVREITIERESQIKYYQNNPQDEEAWIVRYPIYTIHGADIEEGDNYHFETFKYYYNLPQDMNKIKFYFKEEY